MSTPPEPRRPLPDKGKERLAYEAAVIVWNGEADRVELYRCDGDLKMRPVREEETESA